VFAVVLGTAAAVAGASWSAQGTGAAKAKAGQLAAVTATPAAPSTELFPGGSADSALTLTNPNPVAMTVSSIVANGAITSDTEGCNADSVSFLNQTGAWEIARNAVLTVQLPNSVTMSLDANDACQGASFTIPVSVTASVSGQGGSADPTTTTSTTAPAAPAKIAWQQSTYAFPPTEVNTQAQTTAQTTLKNIGGSPAQLEQGAWGNAEFGGTTDCFSRPLQPGQTCLLSMIFKPAAVGTRSAPFQARLLGSSDEWSTMTAVGEGVNPPYLAISPGFKDFGTVTTESAPFGFQITNTGGAPARSVLPQIVGTDARDFLIKGSTCDTYLNAGATCVVTVSFRPQTHTGAHSASLRMSYANSAGTPNASTAGLAGYRP
jgi:hypothetical protein